MGLVLMVRPVLLAHLLLAQCGVVIHRLQRPIMSLQAPTILRHRSSRRRLPRPSHKLCLTNSSHSHQIAFRIQTMGLWRAAFLRLRHRPRRVWEAHLARFLVSYRRMVAWRALHPRFGPSSKIEPLPHETGIQVHINTTLTLPPRVELQAELLHQLPPLSPLKLPHANAKIAPLRHPPSVSGSGRTVSTWDPSPQRMMKSAKSWTSRTAADPPHRRTASPRPRCLATVLKMLRTLGALMTDITHLRLLIIHRPCRQ
jgi:hypothetical protein